MRNIQSLADAADAALRTDRAAPLEFGPAEPVATLRERYRSIAPFPHLVVEGLFAEPLIRGVAEAFGDVDPGMWESSDHVMQRKRGTSPSSRYPRDVQRYFDTVNSPEFVAFLSDVTGISGLVADPSLFGGGLHDIPVGGKFELHVDFQRHPTTGLQNRLVVITYLNDDWLPEYGGELELWSWKPRAREVSIAPVFGRTVLMEVGTHNIHGHPRRVTPPEGRTRRSIASYYYSPIVDQVGPPAVLATAYVRRPGAGLASQLACLALALAPDFLRSGAKRLLGRRPGATK